MPISNRSQESLQPKPKRVNAYTIKKAELEKQITSTQQEIDNIKSKIDLLSKKMSKRQEDEKSNPFTILKNKKDDIVNEKRKLFDDMALLKTTKKDFSDYQTLLTSLQQKDESIREMERAVERAASLNDEKNIVKNMSKLRKERKEIQDKINQTGAPKVSAKSYAARVKEINDGIEQCNAQIAMIEVEMEKTSEKFKVEQEANKKIFDERKKLKDDLNELIKKKGDLKSDIIKLKEDNKASFEQAKIKREKRQQVYQIERKIGSLEIDKRRVGEDQPFVNELTQCHNLANFWEQLYKKDETKEKTVKNVSEHNIRQVEPVDEGLIFKKKDSEDEDFYSSMNKKSGSKKKQGGMNKPSKVIVPAWVASGMAAVGLTVPTSTENMESAVKALRIKEEEYQQSIGPKEKANEERVAKIDQEIQTLMAEKAAIELELMKLNREEDENLLED